MEGRDWGMWKQNIAIDLGHKAQNGTCYFNETSLSDIFPAKDKDYSHSVAGSKQNPKIPGWKEVRGRGPWDLCKASSLLLCPLIHLPACQETAYLSMQRSIKVTAGLGWVLGKGSNINEWAQPGTHFCPLHTLNSTDWTVGILYPSVFPSDDLFI